MTRGEDYLMRPVLNNLCQYESLKNGLISLLDITKMNEALDVQFENQWRARQKK